MNSVTTALIKALIVVAGLAGMGSTVAAPSITTEGSVGFGTLAMRWLIWLLAG